MKQKITSAAGFLAALLLLGIVGTVERGGDLLLMLWTIPLLTICAACARVIEKNIEKEARKNDSVQASGGRNTPGRENSRGVGKDGEKHRSAAI